MASGHPVLTARRTAALTHSGPIWAITGSSFHRDGSMRVDGNYGSTLGYEPNSYSQWQQQPNYAEPPLALEGPADRWNFREDDDYYAQPCMLFRLMSPEQQQALFGQYCARDG